MRMLIALTLPNTKMASMEDFLRMRLILLLDLQQAKRPINSIMLGKQGVKILTSGDQLTNAAVGMRSSWEISTNRGSDLAKLKEDFKELTNQGLNKRIS